jgi:hypothetical protein
LAHRARDRGKVRWTFPCSGRCGSPRRWSVGHSGGRPPFCGSRRRRARAASTCEIVRLSRGSCGSLIRAWLCELRSGRDVPHPGAYWRSDWGLSILRRSSGAKPKRLRPAASLRFNRALTRELSRRPPWPAATWDWCCARSAANIRANDPARSGGRAPVAPFSSRQQTLSSDSAVALRIVHDALPVAPTCFGAESP